MMKSEHNIFQLVEGGLQSSKYEESIIWYGHGEIYRDDMYRLGSKNTNGSREWADSLEKAWYVEMGHELSEKGIDIKLNQNGKGISEVPINPS